jgi:hypothetical protein
MWSMMIRFLLQRSIASIVARFQSLAKATPLLVLA